MCWLHHPSSALSYNVYQPHQLTLGNIPNEALSRPFEQDHVIYLPYPKVQRNLLLYGCLRFRFLYFVTLPGECRASHWLAPGFIGSRWGLSTSLGIAPFSFISRAAMVCIIVLACVIVPSSIPPRSGRLVVFLLHNKTSL